MSHDEVTHDAAARTFQVSTESGTAVLRYRELPDGRWDLYSTYTPPAARGQGLAARVTAAALAAAAAEGREVIPSCSYVAAYLARNGLA